MRNCKPQNNNSRRKINHDCDLRLFRNNAERYSASLTAQWVFFLLELFIRAMNSRVYVRVVCVLHIILCPQVVRSHCVSVFDSILLRSPLGQYVTSCIHTLRRQLHGSL
uniref:Uncharacterized protein n=1 Tax=Rhipicephalus microplus TaxID=6941 RepID=A0A6G5AGQ4_RHIMP